MDLLRTFSARGVYMGSYVCWASLGVVPGCRWISDLEPDKLCKSCGMGQRLHLVRMASGPALPDTHERMARLYLGGPDGVVGNATEAYARAFPCDGLERVTVQQRGNRVIRSKRLRVRLAELRAETLAQASPEIVGRLREWVELAPDAQQTLHRAATGSLPAGWSDEDKRQAVRAAERILDRAIGKVADTIHLGVGGHLAAAVLALPPGYRPHGTEPAQAPQPAQLAPARAEGAESGNPRAERDS